MSEFADTDRLSIGLIEEVAWGVTPATPELIALRVTGESLKKNFTSKKSDEITPDRQINDARTIGGGVGGSLPFEFSYKEYDTILAHVLESDYSTPQTITGTDLSIVAGVKAAQTINFSGNVTNNDTIIFNGHTITFKTSPSGPDEVAVGGSLATSLTNLEVLLNAHASALISVATYSEDGTTLTITYDAFGTAGNAYTVAEGVDSGLVMTVNGATLTGGVDQSLDSAGSNFVVAQNAVGSWTKITGSVNGVNNTFCEILTSTTSRLTLKDFDGALGTLVAESGNANLSYKSAKSIINGSTKKSFTIEKGLNDVNAFFQYRGMRTGAFELNFSSREAITGKADFVGKGETTSSATIDNNGSYTPSQTNPFIDASNNIPKFHEGGVKFTGSVKSFSLSIKNNLREQDQIGSPDNAGIGVGRGDVSGKAQMYFSDLTVYDKFNGNIETSFMEALRDEDGNAVIISLPRVKFMGGEVPAPGAEQDVMQTYDWQALKDKTKGYTIRVCMIDK